MRSPYKLPTHFTTDHRAMPRKKKGVVMRYYNDNDPKIIEWLRSLERAGTIGSGTIDGRSIKDVKSNDLVGFTRCHFFAGIGGWEYALQLAG